MTKEPIIAIVGFLGAGKTTLLKQLVESLSENHKPYVILNDYQNATIDAQQFLNILDKRSIKALTGSCICCSGVAELRNLVNNISPRKNGVTLIEANGTTDACSLMGFLGIGVSDHFLPPVQISVVDARHWQARGEHNDLEANQIQVSSLVVLNYVSDVSAQRKAEVIQAIAALNAHAEIIEWDDLQVEDIFKLTQVNNAPEAFDHHKSHWASCSVDLPNTMTSEQLSKLLELLPKALLRIKGFTHLNDDTELSFFERTPTGETFIRPYRGDQSMKPKILTVGVGSDPVWLARMVDQAIS